MSITHRTVSPRDDYQIKTNDQSPGLSSKNSLDQGRRARKKANLDLLGVEEMESDRESVKNRVESLQKKGIQRQESAVSGTTPARNMEPYNIGIDSDQIITHSNASNK